MHQYAVMTFLSVKLGHRVAHVVFCCGMGIPCLSPSVCAFHLIILSTLTTIASPVAGAVLGPPSYREREVRAPADRRRTVMRRHRGDLAKKNIHYSTSTNRICDRASNNSDSIEESPVLVNLLISRKIRGGPRTPCAAIRRAWVSNGRGWTSDQRRDDVARRRPGADPWSIPAHWMDGPMRCDETWRGVMHAFWMSGLRPNIPISVINEMPAWLKTQLKATARIEKYSDFVPIPRYSAPSSG